MNNTSEYFPAWLKVITIILGISFVGFGFYVLVLSVGHSDTNWGWFVGAIILWIIGASCYPIAHRLCRSKRIREINQKVNELSNNETEMSVSDFLRMRNQTFGGRGSSQYVKDKQFSGVYILYNKTKNMYYVGQAQYIFDRVNAHFTGKGNGDVYADYKYGDEFTIKMISLQKSGYVSLNELERHTIMVYDAFSKGYNKTRGNKF